MNDQSGQMSTISKKDQEIQQKQSIDEISIQVEQEKSSKGNQKSVSVGNYSVQMTKKSLVD